MIESHERLDILLKGEKYQEPELGAKTKDPAGCSCSGWRHLFKRSQKTVVVDRTHNTSKENWNERHRGNVVPAVSNDTCAKELFCIVPYI